VILCDIGNTTYHFKTEDSIYKKNVKSFNPDSIKEKVFYISVNKTISKKLDSLQNWIDLATCVDKDGYYETMGIDRVIACEAIDDGIIVDAGSAITVDRVKNGVFMGGFIFPGINAMQKCFTNISKALEYSFNFECDLDIMPKNSQDAISYGYLKTLYSEVTSYKQPIYLTGGDAQKFKSLFKNAKVDEFLLFDGMKKIIQKAKLC
jgi:type III pantothenate kinase